MWSRPADLAAILGDVARVWEPDEVTRRPIGMKIILLATAALLAVTLAGCGDEDPTTMANDEPAGLSLDDLDGRAFASVRVDGHQLVNDTQIRLGFAGDEVRADAGCNHLFGTMALDGGTLTASNIGGTEMGCPDGLNDQDAWLVGVPRPPVPRWSSTATRSP